MKRFLKLFVISIISSWNFISMHAIEPQRIITIGGSITEIVYQLGDFSKIVGCDTSSVYPRQTDQLPKVGYWMRLSSEGIIALKPDLIIVSSQAKQEAVYQQLRGAKIRVEIIEDISTLPGTYTKIMQIGKALGKIKQATALNQNLQQKMNLLQNKITKNRNHETRVMFIYARGLNQLMVAGKNTQADDILRLTGVKNAITEFRDHKQLTSENVVTANPDVILMTTKGYQSVGGAEGVGKIPGISLTKAYKNQRIIYMDDLLLLGFTARLVDAVNELNEKIHSYK